MMKEKSLIVLSVLMLCFTCFALAEEETSDIPSPLDITIEGALRDAKREPGININQPISVGDYIYQGALGSVIKAATYIYEGVENNAIKTKVKYCSRFSDECDFKKEANLTQLDSFGIAIMRVSEGVTVGPAGGRWLLVQVVDDTNRIIVFELTIKPDSRIKYDKEYQEQLYEEALTPDVFY
ncbi:hypothetical protein ACFL1K_01715 [Candidatus Omnitrophota bacterium]